MKESKDGKEMLGGCCVCSDDRGWTENPLVYCDGQGCNVAVHQACYGIVAVPSGPWFCRKCESQERAARVRCELCPSKDGALKRTDSSSVAWAHVVCALYIPEVRFGNVTTMEPIILSMVPQDRFNKSCYICEGQGREAKSKLGACMNCNKPGCKHHFHVTCAQAMGLLCEEAGNYQDNVKYCGYCQHHYSKLKKGSNVKTIPAFKPVPPIGAPSESNPSDKFTAIQAGGSSWGGQPPSGASNGSKEKQRKKPGRKSGSQVFPKAGNSRDSTSSSVIVEGPNAGDDSKMKKNEANPMYPNVLAGVGLVPGPRATMTDQCSSGADRHESSDSSKHENARNSETTKASGMKKNEKSMDGSKHSGSITSGASSAFPELLPSVTSITDKSRTARRKGSTRSASPTSQGGNDTESTLSNVSDLGLAPAPEASVVGEQCKGQPPIKYETPAASENNSSMGHSVIVSSASAHHSESSSTQVQSSQSVPQRAISPLIISTSAGSSQSQNQAKLNYNKMFQDASKELVASATPAKKARRGRTPKVTAPVVPDSPPSSPDSAEQAPKRRKKATKSAATAFHNDDRHELTVAVNRAEDFLSAHLNQHAPTTENLAKRESASINQTARENLNVSRTPASLPTPSPMPANNVGTKDLNSYKDSSAAGKENNLYLRNGLAVPHMLGNQLNPNSSVAQQLTDTLAAEVEAHSITNQPSPISSNSFTGVPFPVRPVSPSLKMNLPSGSATSAVPQTMEQLLERQWEHGSQFLMGQAQQFDIASLLSCLHNLRQENMRLEDQVADLKGRRDRLLVVHARLSVPLAVQSSHMAFGSTSANLLDRSTPVPGHPAGHALRASPQERERNNRGTPYLPQMENGIGLSEHLSAFTGTAFSSPHGSHRSSASSSHQSDRIIPSPIIVSSRSNPVYHPVPSVGTVSVPSTMSPVQGASSFMSAEGRNLTVLRSPSSTPEMRPEVARSTAASSQQQPPYGYQIVSPPLSVAPHHPGSYANMVTTMTNANQLNARREGSDSRHPIGRPSPIERR